MSFGQECRPMAFRVWTSPRYEAATMISTQVIGMNAVVELEALREVTQPTFRTKGWHLTSPDLKESSVALLERKDRTMGS